ncbi:hypothetical protein PR001_g16824 [Phytophthora rubi]|uniref:Transposase MuDR plant domain-containing protein n=1 Tax=Phytophthora rubi TaxID=129364 RepID=A0A6A3KKP8_9STRA|nr:hypothetical protein PR001_g16824 [Phytophthora rubi]
MEEEGVDDFPSGSLYPDKKAFKLAVVAPIVLVPIPLVCTVSKCFYLTYLTQGKRSCYFPDNNSVKITARCKIKGCPFAARGRLTREGRVRVTSSQLDHSRQPLQHKTLPTIIAKPVAATELRNKTCVKASDVHDNSRTRFGADIPYKQAYDALQREKQSVDMRGASYRLMEPWLNAMATANPGSVVDLVVSSGDNVERAFLALGACGPEMGSLRFPSLRLTRVI